MGEAKAEAKRTRKPEKEISEAEYKALLAKKISGYKMKAVYDTLDAKIVRVSFLASL